MFKNHVNDAHATFDATVKKNRLPFVAYRTMVPFLLTMAVTSCSSSQGQQSGDPVAAKSQNSAKNQSSNGNSANGANAANNANSGSADKANAAGDKNASANLNSAVDDFQTDANAGAGNAASTAANGAANVANTTPSNVAPVNASAIANTPVNSMIPASIDAPGNAAALAAGSGLDASVPGPVNTVKASEQDLKPGGASPQIAVSRLAQGSLDLGPAHGTVEWVGYNYQRNAKKIEVQIVTNGRPVYKVFQEVNRAKQSEIVVRFLNTDLRRKIRRDIDASEFRSPVAYVRMRHDHVFGHTDVIVTMRDSSSPHMVVQGSSVLLSFDIPEHWFGPMGHGNGPIAKADVQADPNIMPATDSDSEVSPDSGHGSVATWVDDPGATTFSDAKRASTKSLVKSNKNNELVPVQGERTAKADVTSANPAQDTAGKIADSSRVAPGTETQRNPPKEPAQESSGTPAQTSPAGGASPTTNPVQSGPSPGDSGGGPGAKGSPSEKGDAPAGLQPKETSSGPVKNFEVRRIYEERFTIAGVAQAPGNFSADIPPVASAASSTDAGQNVGAPAGLALDGAGTGVSAGSAAGVPSGITPVATTDITGIETTSASGAPAPASSGKKALRMDFRAAPLSSVLRVISSESGTNFIMPPAIGATIVSIALKDVPWDIALKAILETNRLGMEEIGPHLVRVDSLGTFIADRDAQDKAKQANLALVQTKILIMRLSYMKADEAAKVATQMLPKPSDPSNIAQARNFSRFKVQADMRMNAVIVEATPDELGRIKTLLEKLDVQTPQVKIASRIVEVSQSAANALGVSWGQANAAAQSQGLVYGTPPTPFGSADPNVFDRQTQVAIDPNFAGSPIGSANFMFGSIANLGALDLKLKMLESSSKADSLQNQEILVEDMQEANIVAGRTSYVKVEGGGTAAAMLVPVDYNTSLKVLPHITADGAVQMKVDISGDKPEAIEVGGAAAPKSTRHMTTTLIRRSGDTAVIGGFYSNDKKFAQSGIPILSDLPLIGALFRSRSKSDDRRDLLIMITPTIVNPSASLGSGDISPTVPAPGPGATPTASNAPPAGNIAQDAGALSGNSKGGNESNAANAAPAQSE